MRNDPTGARDLGQAESDIENHVGQLRLDGTVAAAEPSPAEIGAMIEALLLVATEPPSVSELAAGAALEADAIERGLEYLRSQHHRGWVVQRHGDRVQLATAPYLADRVRTFLGLDREVTLTAAQVETLAVVAYRQPITRAEVDAVRGVDSSGMLAKLHARDLIEPVSRLPTVGNPIQYGTTAEFLRHFGLRSIDELPELGSMNGRSVQEMLTEAITTAGDTEEPMPGPPADNPNPGSAPTQG